MIKGIVPALAEGGKLKLGGLGETRKSRKGEDYRMPVKLDHFIVTTTERDASTGDLIIDDEMMAALPKDEDGHCRQIPIVLHDDDIERVFPTTYALYQGRTLVCRGDGESATRFEVKNGEKTGAFKDVDCTCAFLDADSGPICKPHGTLHCSIRIPGHAVAGSVHKWRTTSIISIRQMIGSLQQIRDVCGALTGIPLWLVVKPIKVTPVGSTPTTVYCCHVELRATDVQAVQRDAIAAAEMRRRVRQSIGYRAFTPPAVDETPEEEADVQQEFHPDVDPNAPPVNGNGNGTAKTVTLDDVMRGAGATKDPAPPTQPVVYLGDYIQAVNELVQEIEARKAGQGKNALIMAVGKDDLDGLTKQQLEEAAEFLRSILPSFKAAPAEPEPTTDLPPPKTQPTPDANGQRRLM